MNEGAGAEGAQLEVGLTSPVEPGCALKLPQLWL